MRPLPRLSVLAALIAAWPCTQSFGQVAVDTTFTYQGQLKRDAIPVSESCDFQFRLYNALVGGSRVGVARSINAVPVTNGLFSVELNFGIGVFSGDQRFLDVLVQCPGDVAMIPLTPRHALRAAPYASTALKTVGVDGNSLDALDGSPTDAVRVDSAGKVWMEKGGLTIFDDQGHGISLTSDEFSFKEGSSEDPVYDYSSINDAHVFWTDGTRRMVIDANGDVGIGTDAPAALLHLGGTPGVDGLMFPDGTLQTTASTGGGGTSLWSESGSNISYSLGNVGIGEANPTAPLHIVGPPVEGAVVQIDTVGEDATALQVNATGYPGFGIVVSATDTAIHGSSPIEGGTFYASGVGGRGLAGIASAATGDGRGVYGRSNSAAGHAGYFEGRGYFSGSVGIGTENPQYGLHVIDDGGSTAIGGENIGEGTSGFLGHEFAGVYGRGSLALFGETVASTGSAVYARATAQSGINYAVRGHTSSANGYAAYFTGGRNYFGGYVGIGTSTPAAKLHIGGTAGSDGIMFPDGTLQTTAAVGGGGDSLWSQVGADIFYTAGRVGIGTSAPQGKLQLAGSNANLLMFENGGSPFLALGDSSSIVGWLQWSSADDELDLYTYGHNYPIAIGPTASGGVFIDTVANGGNVGIGTTAPLQPLHVAGTTYIEGRVGIGVAAPLEDLHVAGDSRFDGHVGIGIAPTTFSPLQISTDTLVGMKATTTFPIGGAGVWGEVTAATGEGRGVYGVATSEDGVGVYGQSAGTGVEGIGGEYGVKGEADGSVGFSFGVAGNASTESGRGVTAYNSFSTGDPIAIWGGTAASDGFGGYFQGRGYFRDSVTIGGIPTLANQLTVRDDPVYTFDALSSMGVQDHTAFIDNEYTPGLFQITGVLALRANAPVGGAVSYVTFYQKDSQTFVTQRAGNIRGDGLGGVVFESVGSDYAEWLPVVNREEKFEPGDVVSVVGGKISKNTQGAHQVMVISKSPIVVGNMPLGDGDEHNGYEKVAFIGQASVKVRGQVAIGDFVIASGSNDGTAVAVAPGKIMPEQLDLVIGRAWEVSSGDGVRTVNVAIGIDQLGAVSSVVNRMHRKQVEKDAVIDDLKAKVVMFEQRIAELEKLTGQLVSKAAVAKNGNSSGTVDQVKDVLLVVAE